MGKCPEKKKEIVRLSKEEIMENSYLKNIVIEPAQIQQISLSRKKRRVLPNWLGFYKEESRNPENFQMQNSYFVCNGTLYFPAVIEGDTNAVWMSVEPCEIESFKEFIEEAKGNVLLCGCGLGYVAYMLSLKSDVNHITILELNPDIIQMFQKHILPQFENKDKISIVETDAITYLKNQDLKKYQYVNVDIWKDTLDMLPIYLECLGIEFKNPSTHFSYWLEPTLKALIQKHILMDISGFRDDVYLLASEIGQDLVKQANLTNRRDVQQLFSLFCMRQQLWDWYQSHPDEFQSLKLQEGEIITDLKRQKKF